MNNPVFISQNTTGFSRPRSQPNSNAKNVLASTALFSVDQSSCGIAIADATAKNVNHSRQRIWTSARHAAIPITTMKL